jgi:hypothetical protein
VSCGFSYRETFAESSSGFQKGFLWEVLSAGLKRIERKSWNRKMDVGAGGSKTTQDGIQAQTGHDKF